MEKNVLKKTWFDNSSSHQHPYFFIHICRLWILKTVTWPNLETWTKFQEINVSRQVQVSWANHPFLFLKFAILNRSFKGQEINSNFDFKRHSTLRFFTICKKGLIFFLHYSWITWSCPCKFIFQSITYNEFDIWPIFINFHFQMLKNMFV